MSPAGKPSEGIAIVGMAGRFPRAKNLEEFWRNLRDGVEAVSFFNDDELQWSPLDGPLPPSGPDLVKARAVLEQAEWFDAAFFGVIPKEAELMDPQHRIFLECAWEALENAGCNPATCDGLIGVFAGASMNTYLRAHLLAAGPHPALGGAFQLMLASEKDYLPTRVSYKLNLRGPSLNVQTACSTSLVAVCLACQNLLAYQCDLALAGGVSLTFPAKKGQLYQEDGIISPDGHCRAFDINAAGTVSGDGVGLVVLKRLSDALAESDSICAVIRGSAINNDGAGKIGYTAPSVDGQAEVIALAQADAGVEPDTISYIEAHGTGTPLGDPIEIAGLAKAFGARPTARPFCAIGSVKTNIGHLDAAAGVAGLIKTVLALQHRQLPPSLHFQRPNPKIDFAGGPFYVNAALQEWPQGKTPRRAGVSSFGLGGTNAHVVLEEAPACAPPAPSRASQLLLLSAQTPSALETATDHLAGHLQRNPTLNLADLSFTLQTGRKSFAHRRLLVCSGVDDAAQALGAREAKRVVTGQCHDEEMPVVFMFPGQGTQYINMARELYEHEPAFRTQVDRCSEILRPHLECDLRPMLFPRPGEAEEAARRLAQTDLAQPALFVIEYALALLWMEWGVRPQVMIGHSVGEYVAACLSGVFSLNDALALVALRGRLQQGQPPGAMLAVRLPEGEMQALLGPDLSLAAVNTPNQCVVSGPFEAISALEEKLVERGLAGRPLRTSHAFHSAMMEPAVSPFTVAVRRLKLNPPQIPWVSNVTGRWITMEEATDPEYWAAHMRRPVRFADGLGALARGEKRVLLEVGPKQTLGMLARQHPAFGPEQTIVSSLGPPDGPPSDLPSILHALGRLWLAGVAVDWRGFYAQERRRRVPLPTYPFERKRYWIERAPTGANERSLQHHGRQPVPAAGRNGLEETTANGAVPHSDGSPSAPSENPTLATLKSVFQELSGLDLTRASVSATFFELGFDSLFLTQASLAVQKRFGINATFRQLREELLTLEKLAAWIEQQKSRPELPGEPMASARPMADSANMVSVPLTDAQREVWFAAQMGAEISSAYNESCTLRLRGPLDPEDLRHAIKQLVERHEALRTTFSPSGEIQRIAPVGPGEVPLVDFSELAGQQREAQVDEFILREVGRPFNLVDGPLWRAHLVRLDQQYHWLVLVVQHLICDGWSLGVLLNELGQLYSARRHRRPDPLPPPMPFRAYAQRQLLAQSRPEFAAAESYWLGQFSGEAPVLELPTDRPRPAARTYAAGYRTCTLPPATVAAVKRLSAEHSCTAFTLLFAAFNVLLYRLSGQADIVVGVPAAGQVLGGMDNLVGHCANLLPVHSRLAEKQKFSEYLAATRQKIIEALEYWRYPFGTLLRRLNLPRDSNRVPLANVVFNATRLRGALHFEELTAEIAGNPKRFVNFDLNFNFATMDEGLCFGCYYSSELFDDSTIERLFSQFETLLNGVITDPGQPLASLPLLNEVERGRLLVEWNATQAEYPKGKCIHQLFTEQAGRTPEATALVWKRERVTYRELNQRADRLAEQLRARGVRPDILVGIFLERTPDLVAAILGVLKAGGAYVPLDPAYPPERLAFIVGDAHMPILITQRELAAQLPAGRVDILLVDKAGETNCALGGSPPREVQPTTSLAYVIYTSGSTGQPKGVAIEHRSVAALIAWARQVYRPEEFAGLLASTSVCFDVSVFELLVPLCCGGKVILAENILQLPGLPAADEVVMINTVPSAMRELLATNMLPPSVRTLNLAGEPLPQCLVEQLYQKPGIERVFDLYGPTEATVYSTFALRQPGGRATIGRPIANEQVYILDRHLQPVPVGVPGELYLGGAGLARGYWQRAELTAEKFPKNPFQSGTRLYRTSDLVRYRPDGNIEFLGRLDQQVKLRGYRIELGEIESVLRQHAAVRECVAVVRTDNPDDKRVVAYVVPVAEPAIDSLQLRRHMRQKLPEYMVPSAFVMLKKLPLTPSGKVDQRALPAPDQAWTDRGQTGVAPRTTTEEALADIWREVLGLGRIGIHDNFFELGGHSLLATQVLTRVQDNFRVELPLRRFFGTPTIAELASAIEETLVEEIKTMSDEEADRLAGEAMLSAKE